MPRDTLDISDRLARRRAQDAKALATQKRQLGELMLRTGAEKLKIVDLEALLRWRLKELEANPRAAEGWRRAAGFPGRGRSGAASNGSADPRPGDLLARAAAE